MVKALVLEAYNQLVYQDVPEPAVGPEEVLIQVQSCAICGSDLHGLDGSTGRRIPPLIMGHEAAGIIAEVGSAVSGWQVGEAVTFDSTIYCGRCYYCRRGSINLCDNRRVIGVSCDEYRRHGAFAEYVAVPQHIMYRLPEGLSHEQATMVEPLSIAFHAVELTPVSLNDTAVVIGAGTIGLMAIQALRMAGCGHIVAVDLAPARLDLALQVGADEALTPDEGGSAENGVVDLVLARTEGRGADLAFEAVGLRPTVNLATRVLRKGGTLTLIGNVAPKTELLLQAVVTRQLRLQGSCASNGEYPACLAAIARGNVVVEPLISAVAPLAEGGTWFERLYRREPGLLKVILQP